MSDDLTGVFDHLTPDDFAQSSVRYTTLQQSTPDFNAWVDEQIQTTRVAWLAADGLMNPFAVMRTTDGRTLLLSPDDDETIGNWIARLGREAQKNRVTWFFTVVKTVGGVYTTEALQDIDAPLAIEEAQKRSALKPILFFHGERRNDPNLPDARRHGLIPIDDTVLGEVFNAPPEFASPLMLGVLS